MTSELSKLCLDLVNNNVSIIYKILGSSCDLAQIV